MVILEGALVGVGFAASLLATTLGLRRAERSPRGPLGGRMRPVLRRMALALPLGVLAGVVTGWPAAGVLGLAAGLGLPGLFRRSSTGAISRIEAIAAWTEMLRDTLVGQGGLTEVILASVSVAPAAIAPQVRALGSRVDSGTPLGAALRSFAQELADPAGDAVVAALVLTAEAGGAGLAALLGELATSARAEVAMRLRVETSRARSWSAMRTTAGVSIGFIALASLAARPYLAPYASPLGQLVLLVVGAAFACGFWSMARMVRPRAPERLFEAPR